MSRSPSKRPSGRFWVLIAIASLLVTSLPVAAVAQESERPGCDERNNRTYRDITDCVTLDGVMEHLEAFQAIADANDGNRAEGTSGYTASVEYVVETMEAAGWEVERVPFEYPGSEVELRQLTPTEATYATGGYTGTGEGEVTGNVIPVDINLTPPRDNTSGCEPEDFTPHDFSGPNDIALIQRGTCPFGDKAVNAAAAGAEAVILFNQGDTPDREDLIVGTLGLDVAIPVVGASFADGVALAAPGSTAHVAVETVIMTDENVIAEKPGRFDDNVVMAGAHLDSVPSGAGINDNGSGSAVLLEVAEALANHRPNNTLRFAWWGTEEIGLIGSTQYVNNLSEEEVDDIALYLNFDMVGSSNYVFMTYDADESTYEAPVPVPPGSEAIEKVFETFYTFWDVRYDDAEFSGRSDYQAFIVNGIPSGGLFTGAEVVKTAQQQAIWGGTAGQSFDPCYHQACDDIDNISAHALDVNADAVAWAVLTFAHTTEAVNGRPGKRVPGAANPGPPRGPEGTNAGGG